MCGSCASVFDRETVHRLSRSSVIRIHFHLLFIRLLRGNLRPQAALAAGDRCEFINGFDPPLSVGLCLVFLNAMPGDASDTLAENSRSIPDRLASP